MSELAALPRANVARARRPRMPTHLIGLAGYGLVFAALVAGWLFSDRHVLAAEYGLGYLLGVVGASLMALLLLYPLRKRSRLFQNLGPVSLWFRAHMILGVLGPTLILFHCNFELGSFNSRIALFCTLIVAGSGLIGRYIYARIHHGLYGRSASLVELRDAFTAMDDQLTPINQVAPDLVEALHTAEHRVQRGHAGVLGAIAQAFRAAVITRVIGFKLRRQIRQVLDQLATQSPVYAAERERLERNWVGLLDRRLQSLRQFAQFACFERSFALWHVIHYPLFIVMVIAVVLHVIAVHMY